MLLLFGLLIFAVTIPLFLRWKKWSEGIAKDQFERTNSNGVQVYKDYGEMKKAKFRKFILEELSPGIILVIGLSWLVAAGMIVGAIIQFFSE